MKRFLTKTITIKQIITDISISHTHFVSFYVMLVSSLTDSCGEERLAAEDKCMNQQIMSLQQRHTLSSA